MRRLEEELRAAAREAPARAAAVYVEDTQSGLSAGVNGERPFLAASLIKLSVMAAVYDLWRRRPERRTARAVGWMGRMITVSDNASTDRLITLAGGPRAVSRFCARRGWPGLVVSHGVFLRQGHERLNLCTAREITGLLAAIDRRRLVSPSADAEMWAILCRQQKRSRIPAGIPRIPGIRIGSKTGTLATAYHDAAIVRAGRTRYALCILLSRQSSEAAGARFCRRVSRLVFDRLTAPRGEADAGRP